MKGRFNGRFFALRVWGDFYLEGLIFGILRYVRSKSASVVELTKNMISKFPDTIPQNISEQRNKKFEKSYSNFLQLVQPTQNSMPSFSQ